MLTSRLKDAFQCSHRLWQTAACVLVAGFGILFLLSMNSPFTADPVRIQLSRFDTGSEDAHEPVSTNGKKSSKEIADNLLEHFLTRVGDGKGPIIVGGIGDSGTRGMYYSLEHYGVQMLSRRHVSRTRDSLIYMAKWPTTTSKGKRWDRDPSGLYNYPIRHARSLKYNISHTFFEQWHCGRQFIAKILDRSMSVSKSAREAKGEEFLDPWGFKHPRTALLLPFWLASVGEKFVFIHVLRDGKDIVEGDNENLFRDHCDPYYGRKCSTSLTTKANFWADLVGNQIAQSADHSELTLSNRIVKCLSTLLRAT